VCGKNGETNSLTLTLSHNNREERYFSIKNKIENPLKNRNCVGGRARKLLSQIKEKAKGDSSPNVGVD